ncbi:insulin-like growth factor-binding protein complex acid labile subunit [Orussus abietinus]|uniref:insulin-like growth factor-binding protein complex acid labile subunit n=1 Tax=Orussus abietinus TaxID=222816 RepID=UPI00062552AD|nr:insulin-like growth factor-binding protein complex acid labile subunit [Orussus abietinus]
MYLSVAKKSCQKNRVMADPMKSRSVQVPSGSISKRFPQSKAAFRWWLLLPIVFWMPVEGIPAIPGKSSSNCPPRCLCYLDREPSIIVCSMQGLDRFPENVSNLVEHLDLSGNQLDTLSQDDLNRLTELQYLNLADNRLSGLPENISGLKKLRKLDISGNRIKDVYQLISISQLIGLKMLYLSRNPISSLEGLTSGSLLALDVRRCEIGEVSESALLRLPSLAVLSLAENPLRSFQRPVCRSLQWLDMSECLLNYLTPDTFEGLPSLEDLRLANNPALVYSSRFETLRHPHLKKLDVSRCNLDRPGLHGLPSLTQVQLSGNLIRILPDGIFRKNPELTRLSLNGNGLSSINASTFAGLSRLEFLDLSENGLEEIANKDTFSGNDHLLHLNLSFNALLSFPSAAMSVKSLDLSSNWIRELNGEAFANLPNIKILNLSDNRLEELPKNLDSDSLTTFSLAKNRLMRINNDAFSDLPNLHELDISGNRLTDPLDVDVFRSNKNLSRIRLDDNPWRCDCGKLYGIYVYLTMLPEKTPASGMICQSPVNVSGYSWESACHGMWNGPTYENKERVWGFVVVGSLSALILFGSTVSLRHAIRMKRQAREDRRQSQLREARERLGLLQRRSQANEENEAAERHDPRVHPSELTGPPTYEEAVHMSYLARSLNALDEASEDETSIRVMGSVDNLGSKKRRPPRRPRRRRTHSDEDEPSAAREERRSRRRRYGSADVLRTSTRTKERTPCEATNSAGQRNNSMQERRQGSQAEMPQPRPRTPGARKKKRCVHLRVTNGTSSDDEDSNRSPGGPMSNSGTNCVIQHLSREPRSGRGPLP